MAFRSKCPFLGPSTFDDPVDLTRRELVRTVAPRFLSSDSQCLGRARQAVSVATLSPLLRLERLGLHFVTLADQQFHARLGFFQLLAARLTELHALLEQLQRALQRQLATLHLAHDVFEFL
jgi:hypothetical protein